MASLFTPIYKASEFVSDAFNYNNSALQPHEAYAQSAEIVGRLADKLSALYDVDRQKTGYKYLVELKSEADRNHTKSYNHPENAIKLLNHQQSLETTFNTGYAALTHNPVVKEENKLLAIDVARHNEEAKLVTLKAETVAQAQEALNQAQLKQQQLENNKANVTEHEVQANRVTVNQAEIELQEVKARAEQLKNALINQAEVNTLKTIDTADGKLDAALSHEEAKVNKAADEVATLECQLEQKAEYDFRPHVEVESKPKFRP